MSPTISFTVGEGVHKENAMRFWILTAITLMLAGDAIADTQVVGANTSTIRRIKITNDGGVHHMELTIIAEDDPGSRQVSPLIFTTDLILNGKVPANTVNPWLDTCDLDRCDLGRNLFLYVLSLKIGNDAARDVLVLQPEMNTFGQFDGFFSTKVYLADDTVPGSANDTEFYPWGNRVLTERVEILLRRETFDGVIRGFNLEGFIPANN